MYVHGNYTSAAHHSLTMSPARNEQSNISSLLLDILQMFRYL